MPQSNTSLAKPAARRIPSSTRVRTVFTSSPATRADPDVPSRPSRPVSLPRSASAEDSKLKHHACRFRLLSSLSFSIYLCGRVTRKWILNLSNLEMSAFRRRFMSSNSSFSITLKGSASCTAGPQRMGLSKVFMGSLMSVGAVSSSNLFSRSTRQRSR